MKKLPSLRLSLSLALPCSLAAAGAARAQAVSVPNYSFESPSTAFVAPGAPTDWLQTAQPGYFDPSTFGGYQWNQTIGAFLNSNPYITNLDGNQAAYIFSLPGDGLYQDLAATYSAGTPYTMTVGVIGGSGLNAGDTLDLILYYRDGGNNIVPLGDTTLTYSSAQFPNTTSLQDFSVVVPAVPAASPENGQPIGVEILATNGTGSSYWDVDNVRLVPEPASGVLLALGLGAFAFRRRAVR